jgi:hypothetical protein
MICIRRTLPNDERGGMLTRRRRTADMMRSDDQTRKAEERRNRSGRLARRGRVRPNMEWGERRGDEGATGGD